jgi:hypothetical protein
MLEKIPFFKIGIDIEIIGIAGTSFKNYLFTAISIIGKG